MTQTPVARLVVRLGIPTTVAMLITSIYNMADTYFVGTLGGSAQGAIGILFTLQSIIQAVAFMLGHGSGTYVAKELANRDTKKASEYVSTAFFAGGAIGTVLAIVGLATLTPLMRLLGSTETILPHAKAYGMWVFISCPFMICSLVLNNNLRYEGKALFAMIGIGAGGLLNILGDYLFVMVCDMGVFGAGLSTAISQFVSFALLLILFFKTAQSKISFRHISKDGRLYFAIFKNGLPSLIRQALNSVSGGILNRLAGRYGAAIDKADQTIAAMSIVNKVANFIMCVGMGISQGLQPVASFNYQAEKYSRVKKAYFVTVAICFCCVAVISLPTLFWAEQTIRCFQRQDDIVQLATPALQYAMLGLLTMPLFIPVNMLLQSIRKSAAASFLAILRSGLVFIPLLYILTSAMQIRGLQMAQPMADAITALINIPFVIYFMKETARKQNALSNNSAEQSPDDTAQS